MRDAIGTFHNEKRKKENVVSFHNDPQSLPSKEICQAEIIIPVSSEIGLHNEFQHNTMIMK